ncbi:helix-turn-helix transcriptional regulator [Actinoplanes sp. NPDC049265]|uniref:helix-turn-helix transcriptional regulator n=1 Tax=Actinoplanes sp. NPDC049265 TaxID=3363902 RepID=UPI00371DBFB6
MDQDGLAEFLRVRREALRPADVGLPATGVRRTPGLRREEVAELAGIPVDRYLRLERARAAPPGPDLTAALGRALRLERAEFDTLCRLAGGTGPTPDRGYVEPGLMVLLDALTAVPSAVVDHELTVVVQNPLSEALLGRCVGRAGRRSNLIWHWFTDERMRSMGTPGQLAAVGRGLVAELRTVAAWRGPDGTADRLAGELAAVSDEFARLWATTPVGRFESVPWSIDHPVEGRLEVHADLAVTMWSGHRLLMLRPKLGTGTAGRLRRLLERPAQSVPDRTGGPGC